MIIQLLAALITSFTFAMMFNIRGKKLLVASFIGMIGGVTLYLFTINGISKVMALLYASMIISILAEIAARIYKSPVTLFLLSALIPLVPGSGMYYTMLNMVKEDYSMAFTVGVNTLFEASAIVIGSMIISSIIRIIYYYKKNVLDGYLK